MYNKLQYISQGDTVQKQLYNIHHALDNGCNWIQMRFKNQNAVDVFTLAEAVKMLCHKYLATLIINDNVHLCKQLDADGVHLGLKDWSITDARTLLGHSKIIGGTANTLEDVLQRVEENCDYIGLGPFQFTTTKEKLSPILGLEGYRHICSELKKRKISTPIYAIGGITLEDVNGIMETGVHGIAVSGLVTHSTKTSELITQLNEKLYVSI
jgi:thiamine-phosphate pyrophosphorylase